MVGLNSCSFYFLNHKSGFGFNRKCFWGAWVAQSVKRPISAQVMISWFVRSSPASGSVLIAQSLEFTSDSVSLSFSASPQLVLCLSQK